MGIYEDMRALLNRRLQELAAEQTQLVEFMQSLPVGANGDVGMEMPIAIIPMKVKRGPKKMNAAARAKVAKRMKAYWANKRKEQKAAKAAEKD